MDNSFQTSFIPKKPITPEGSSFTTKSSTSITMVVTTFIFFVMVFAAVGLYVYKNYYLEKTKENLSANLFKIRDSFDRDSIAELELYDKRMNVAQEVLNSHIVISPLFELLNELTLSSIQYTKFDHKTTNNTFSVKMSGIAKDYKSIALQADIFNTGKGTMLKDVIFSNLTKDKNNFVTFDVEFNVDPALLSYANNLTDKNEEPQNTGTAVTPVVNPESVTPVLPTASNEPLQATNKVQ